MGVGPVWDKGVIINQGVEVRTPPTQPCIQNQTQCDLQHFRSQKFDIRAISQSSPEHSASIERENGNEWPSVTRDASWSQINPLKKIAGEIETAGSTFSVHHSVSTASNITNAEFPNTCIVLLVGDYQVEIYAGDMNFGADRYMEGYLFNCSPVGISPDVLGQA